MTDDINKALSLLGSQESQAYLRFTLVQNGHVIPTKDFVCSIGVLNAAGKHLDAARFAKTAGDSVLAKECYMNAIEKCEKEQKFEDAGNICKEADLFERAIDNYMKGHCGLKAAVAAESAGFKERAAGLYETASKPLDAARLFEELGQSEKASVLYEKAGLTFDAFRTARDAGLYERAALIWDAAEKPEFGASFARNKGLTVLAERLYKKAIDALVEKPNTSFDDFDKASFLAKDAGWVDIALNLCERGVNVAANKDERKLILGRAIRYCAEAGQHDRAEAYKTLDKILNP